MPRPLRLVPLLLLALGVAACDSGGDGMVTATSTVTVAYEGRLAADDSVFDSSPRATFSLRGVIPGFRDGMLGMVVGESRTFTIPPEQGYGAAGAPPRIPPNATLIFEVTLLGLQ